MRKSNTDFIEEADCRDAYFELKTPNLTLD